VEDKDDFVKTCRVEYALFFFKDNTKSKVTVLEIRYEKDFSSKYSFPSAVKRYREKTLIGCCN